MLPDLLLMQREVKINSVCASKISILRTLSGIIIPLDVGQLHIVFDNFTSYEIYPHNSFHTVI